MPNHQQLQRKTLKTLTAAQIGAGVGTAGTVAAGSLLVASITGSEELAGLAQTFSVLGAAALAIPLARLTSSGGRRRALSVGYAAGVVGSIFAILGGVNSDLVEEAHRAKQLSYVVWGSTVGAVTGPNLMSPAGDLAEKLNLPRLTGPYLISAFTLTFAALLIYMFLKPDPYLTALGEGKSYAAGKKHVKEALSHIWHKPIALFAILAIAIGHVAMVSVMVMTPVHMAHVDVSLRIIGLVISVHVIGMYAFSPIVGSFSDRVGKVKTIQIGLGILLLSCLVSGTAAADDVSRLGMGLFLLGLGWSFTLIAGSALLSSSVDSTLKTSSQGASDLVMNLAGAGGGAIAGVVISSLNYGWLCAFASIPVITLALWSASFRSFESP
ncbi:MAG: hypothetical protein RL534_463 [Actinomycetota bacterium]